MKNLVYTLFVSLLAFIFYNCGGSEDTPDIPPVTTDSVNEDNLIGSWEIYYSQKDLVLLPENTNYNGFRDPEMDGFVTKFYKEGNAYKFTNYNPIKEVIDKGTYKISNGFILFTTEEYKGNDTLYTTKQNVTKLDKKSGLLYINYTFNHKVGGKEFKVSDARRLRNLEMVPNAHTIKDKLIINFDDYVGTWEVYNYMVYINGNYNKKESDRYLDKPNITRFKFSYNTKGQKVGENLVYYADKDETISSGEFPAIIIDDVIHLLFKIQIGDEGKTENDGIFLWIKERGTYIDSETNKQTERILDDDWFRDKDDPTTLYRVSRYLKKIQ